MSDTQSQINCLGMIMDGNRRWAKARDLPTLEGHRKGAEVFRDTVRFIRDQGIPHAVFYAFSSENWNRSEDEVAYLMDLFAEQIEQLHETLTSDGEAKVRFRFIGDIGRFSKALQEKIAAVEAESAEYTNTTIWIALSYGGRDEIMEAVNKAVQAGEPLTEEAFRALFWSTDMPDPDVIVRTGGQKRLSNFLTWQSVYSELIFIDKLWPDITIADLEGVLSEYTKRTRNFGT